MRYISSIVLSEKGFQPDVIEAALAQIDNNQVSSAYNRWKHSLDQRGDIMAWCDRMWAIANTKH